MAGIGAEYGTTPLPALRKGLTGTVETFTEGSNLALGTITNALIQVAGDTVTLNGVYAQYTAAASDATKAGTVGDPILINIKGSLTLTLDEAAIVLNASAHASLAVATYSKSGSTILLVTYDTVGTAGNAYTLAASTGGVVSGATLTGGRAAPAISVATEPTLLTITNAANQGFTLADGEETQRKLIYCTLSTTGDAVITPANLNGGTIITLGTTKQYVELRFMSGEWYKVAGDGVVS